MNDIYVKYAEDEIKGLIKKNISIRSIEAQERIKAFQQSLDIIEKYKKKEIRDASNSRKGENNE